jgi:polar amino acid transport system substrate-binding protein
MRPLPLLLIAVLTACGLPRDPRDTLQHVQGGVVRVGIAANPPWTTDSAGHFGGIEPALVQQLAGELGATVAWLPGGESVLMPQLHEGAIDLVIGGIDAKTPWKADVGVTRRYYTTRDPGHEREMVWVVPPGENAWHMRVERFLREHGSEIEQRVSRTLAEQKR